jgi:uncharacterized membrane protein
MTLLLKISAFISTLLAAAIFGFFYAWVSSTMWGLDQIDSEVAIQAMQGMNASVRNVIFGLIFFGTAPALLLTAGITASMKLKKLAVIFTCSGVIYLLGGAILTFMINVPMNEQLALVQLPLSPEEAQSIWQNYSKEWQFWNQTRTVFSGLAFLIAAYGIYTLGKTKTAQG